VSDKMNPIELVKLIEILNPSNKPGRITIITRMGAENMRVKLPHLIRAVRHAGQIVTWITDPMHGNTIKAPCSLKTRPFDSILVCSALRSILWLSDTTSMTTKDRAFNYLWYVPSCVYQFCPRHVNLIVE
jgi:3-deoxy-D-arabino-heptulosonate 7-phosphate (DAHP) synthase class II